MEPQRAVDADNGGGEAQNRALVADLHHFIEEQDLERHQSDKSDPDPHWSEKKDPDPHWSEKKDPDPH